MNRAGRIAVYLCLLLVLNEFGPAHFKRVGLHELKLSKPKTESGGEKRSIIGTFGKYVLKSLVVGSKFMEQASAIATVIGTFYHLVTQCCDAYPQTCEFTKEAKNIQVELEEKKNEMRDILLETKNLESMIIMAQTEFNYTVLEMHKIGQASGRLLRSISSNITLELNLLDNKLETLVQEKAALNQTIQYVKIETQYFNVLDGVLGIALPLFTTIIPAVPKLKLWIKARMGRYKVYELDHSVDAKTIEAPKKGSARYKAGNSWFGKQTLKIVDKIENVKTTLQTKYKKALNVAKKVKAGLGVALSFIQSAFNIYTLYKQSQQCKKAFEDAEKAVIELRKAKAEMTRIYDEVVEAKTSMEKARDTLNEQLTSEIFLSDLTELKETISKLTGEGTDADLQNVIIASIDQYINGIKDKDPKFVETVKLISKLYEGLGQLSTYFDCYSAKANVVRKVVEDCQQGEGSFATLKTSAFNLYEDQSEMCKQKIGIAPFSDDTLQNAIDQRSQEFGFNRICEANDEFQRERVCSKYCGGKNKEDLGHAPEVIEELMKGCKCEIQGRIKAMACRQLKKKSPQQVFEELFVDLSLDDRYTLQQLEQLDCSSES